MTGMKTNASHSPLIARLISFSSASTSQIQPIVSTSQEFGEGENREVLIVPHSASQ